MRNDSALVIQYASRLAHLFYTYMVIIPSDECRSTFKLTDGFPKECIGPGAMGLRYNIAHHTSTYSGPEDVNEKAYNEGHRIFEKSMPLYSTFKFWIKLRGHP
jgi:hypothetical protein